MGGVGLSAVLLGKQVVSSFLGGEVVHPSATWEKRSGKVAEDCSRRDSRRVCRAKAE